MTVPQFGIILPMLIPKEGFSPFTQEEMRKQNIIFASDGSEAMVKSREVNGGELIVCATGDLDFLLNRWLHTDGNFPSWTQLNGVRVLDLAAGSCHTKHADLTYYPHFSRLCAVNGAEVVAIDIKPQSDYDKMLFKSIRADIARLVQEGQLSEISELSGKTFDIIHSSSFVGWNPDPALEHQLSYMRMELAEFEEKLILECLKLLAEGGVMSLDANPVGKGRICFRKVNGKLEKEIEEPWAIPKHFEPQKFSSLD